MPPWLRGKFLATLCTICCHHVLIPRSIQIPLCYNRMEAPQDEGGFAQVWKGKHEGMEVAAKVLRVTTMASDLTKIKKVGFPVCRRARADWLVLTTQRFCKEVMSWKALDHQNTLPLLGVVMSTNQFVMVSEWMVNGRITRFIEMHRDTNRYKLVGFCLALDRICR